MDRLNRTVTWVLVAVLVTAIGGVIYLSMNPAPASRAFTEFYVLGPDGNASDYPTRLETNEEATVIVGVVNHERETVDYRVVVTWNGKVNQEHSFQLHHEETAEFEMAVTAPESPGVYQLRFLLFHTEGEEQLSDPLFLRVNVTEPGV